MHFDWRETGTVSPMPEQVRRRLSLPKEQQMLLDMHRALTLLKAVAPMLKTDAADFASQSQELTDLKRALFPNVDFAMLALNNWARDMAKLPKDLTG